MRLVYNFQLHVILMTRYIYFGFSYTKTKYNDFITKTFTMFYLFKASKNVDVKKAKSII